MEELLQNIRALHVTNEEIIALVENLTQVLRYEYKAAPMNESEAFTLEEDCLIIEGTTCKFSKITTRIN